MSCCIVVFISCCNRQYHEITIPDNSTVHVSAEYALPSRPAKRPGSKRPFQPPTAFVSPPAAVALGMYHPSWGWPTNARKLADCGWAKIPTITEIRPSGMRRGLDGNVDYGGNVNPPCNRKSRAGNPPPNVARAIILLDTIQRQIAAIIYWPLHGSQRWAKILG